MFITNHACTRYVERVLNKKTSNMQDIQAIKPKIISIILSDKNNILFKDYDSTYILIGNFVYVFDQDIIRLITIYPYDDKTKLHFNKLKEAELELEGIMAGIYN
jgi:hypothetical protein